MTAHDYSEDTLVQKTTADYLCDTLGWESVYAYNEETFGSEGLLGRASDREIILKRYLFEKLVELNPGLPAEAYTDAVRQVVDYSASQTTVQTNRDKDILLRDGVQVSFRNAKGELEKTRLRVFDFEKPSNNHFLVVRELWVRGDIYRRRADLIGFVNGVPLIFMEVKNINHDLRAAYDKNFSDYKDTVPHLFHHNAFIILGNGVQAAIGSITSRFEHFQEWKRLEERDPGVVDMETLLKGVCHKERLLDLIENFILFDESFGSTIKIVARNHQYLGVNRAISSVEERKKREGKLGVFWHTQGSGKSYSMVFFTRKIRRKVGGNFTFLICTDRDDLDTQIYKTFAGCGVADNDREPCRASSEEHLRRLLGEHKPFIFTLIQKFHRDVDPDAAYSLRDDIIVITDEAHRTQYGRLALNLRNALPNASYIGFTGTPLFKDDEITKRIFGDYVSTYDFQRAVDDKSTVPLYYDARGDKLGVAIGDLNERIATKLEEIEFEDVNVQERLEQELRRDYHIITAGKRLDQVAKDMVEHYTTAWESGKAMVICIDKITCVRMYDLVLRYWQEKIQSLERDKAAQDEQDEIYRRRRIEWMRETRMAVVVSEEQGEVDKFRKWELDIKPHRALLKAGFELPDGKSLNIEDAYKRDGHPFRIVFVCAMWLTGFDVPSLANLYLDKPLKAHTLMQAIARANRINEGKTNGLIVDYCGVLKNLRQALATFAGRADAGRGGETGDGVTDPARPNEELLDNLKVAIELVRAFLNERSASLDAVIDNTGFERNAAIAACKEAANDSDEIRKHFEIMCREVFQKFKSCLNNRAVNSFRQDRDAINIIYKSLQKDRDNADISDIIRQLHEIVDQAIQTQPSRIGEPGQIYDISRIDFDRLKQEFERIPAPKTTVQNLSQAIQKRLERLLARNPLRTDFQEHYEKIVSEYNDEKDRVTIEKTFEELLKFVQALDEEESRAMREGLDEETLVLFDLLKKPDLGPADVKRIKNVAATLLGKLMEEKLRIDHWRDKESTRDAVRVAIHDFLYSDETGLPVNVYSEDEVAERAEEIFRHVYRTYPTVPSPFYATDSGRA